MDPRELPPRAAEVVEGQARAIGVAACFVSQPAAIAGRVDFLSPFEFLVVAAHAGNPAERDGLLRAYEQDPHEAIRRLGSLYPSPRAEMLLATLAYYDLDADRIRVNLGRVSKQQAPRVLVHEFWHAMPTARAWEEAGISYRTTGFWTQERRPGVRSWVPLDDPNGLPVAPYLLDEAMATRMETRFAGPPAGPPRPDLDTARRFLDRLTEVTGEAAVMRAYLESRPADLRGLVDAHRSDLADVLPPHRDAG